MGYCKRGQLRTIAWLHDRPRVLIAIVAATGIAGVVCLPLLGARLLPDFRENYLIAHASLRAGISLTETARVGEQISKGLMAIPGVKSVAEQIGRAENGQDPDAPNKSEFEVQIDPQLAQRRRDRCRHPRCVRRLSEPARRNLFGAGGAHRRDPVGRIGAILHQRDRLRSRRRRSRRRPDRRGAAAPAGQRQRTPGRATARGGAARRARARPAGGQRPAGGGRARDVERGLSRDGGGGAQAGGPQRSGGGAHCRGRRRSAVGRRSAAARTRRLPDAPVGGRQGHHGALAEPRGSRGRVAPPNRPCHTAGRRSGRLCARGAQGGGGEGAAAGRGLPALRRCCGGAGGSGARAVAALRGGIRADRAGACARLRLLAPCAVGAAGAAEHLDRRRVGGCRDRRDAHLGRHGGIRGAVRHGRPQHHPADFALRPLGGRRARALDARYLDARRRGAA